MLTWDLFIKMSKIKLSYANQKSPIFSIFIPWQPGKKTDLGSQLPNSYPLM